MSERLSKIIEAQSRFIRARVRSQMVRLQPYFSENRFHVDVVDELGRTIDHKLVGK
jgi:hypothetical protein